MLIDPAEKLKSIDDYEKVEKLQEEEEVDLAIIKIFASSNNYSIREAVTVHPSTSLEILKILAYDKDSDVCVSAQKRLL